MAKRTRKPDSPAPAPRPLAIRNRNKGRLRIPASSLLPNPANWRLHPELQRDALRGILEEVGVVGDLLAFEVENPDGTPSGTYMLLDGHLRRDELGDTPVDVTVVDLTPEERAKVLATHDPLGALATADAVQLDALLHEVKTDSAALATVRPWRQCWRTWPANRGPWPPARRCLRRWRPVRPRR